MSIENRKGKRQPVAISGKIYTVAGQPLANCVVRNVSNGGAQIALSRDATDFPAVFILALSRDGAVRRPCAVVWQLGPVLGVKFSTPHHVSESDSDTIRPSDR